MAFSLSELVEINDVITMIKGRYFLAGWASITLSMRAVNRNIFNFCKYYHGFVFVWCVWCELKAVFTCNACFVLWRVCTVCEECGVCWIGTMFALIKCDVVRGKGTMDGKGKGKVEGKVVFGWNCKVKVSEGRVRWRVRGREDEVVLWPRALWARSSTS